VAVPPLAGEPPEPLPPVTDAPPDDEPPAPTLPPVEEVPPVPVPSPSDEPQAEARNTTAVKMARKRAQIFIGASVRDPA
jgi:hypothetical protein